MDAIRKPSPRKQEMINKFFWMRTFLLTAKRVGVNLKLSAAKEQAVIETVWNAQAAYLQADDDDYNYNVAVEAYQMLENGLMVAGIDVEAGVKLAMQRNGYINHKQMKPQRIVPTNFFEIEKPVGAGKSADPWN